MVWTDTINKLNNIKSMAKEYEEDMWHEENSILGGVFRDIIDDIDSVTNTIKKLSGYDILTIQEKYSEVAKQMGVRPEDVDALIRDMMFHISAWHDHQVDEDEYIESLSLDKMMMIVELYLYTISY